MADNEKYSKEFYDSLYKVEDGKDFIISEYHTRIEDLKKAEREKLVADFNSLLNETKDITTALWKDVRHLLKSDQRYKNLKSSKMREKLFEEF